MGNIKAVLFDLDGTLLNRDESVKLFIQDQYERMNRYFPHIQQESYCDRFIELDNRGYVWKVKVYQQLVEEFNIEGIDSEMLLKDYLINFKKHFIPYPNLLSMLEALRQQRLKFRMITNGFGQFNLDNIKSLGIEEYFDVILISEWEGVKKPSPEIFYRALSRLGVQANESIFVGDHPENDVVAAQNVGMIGIWKKDIHWDDIKAKFTIENLDDLITIVENMNGSKGKKSVKNE